MVERKELHTNPENEMNKRRSEDLWFKSGRLEDIKLHRIHSTIRLGNREFGTSDPKGGYGVGDFVTLKIQKSDGSFDEWTTKIIIVSIQRQPFSGLSTND